MAGKDEDARSVMRVAAAGGGDGGGGGSVVLGSSPDSSGPPVKRMRGGNCGGGDPASGASSPRPGTATSTAACCPFGEAPGSSSSGPQPQPQPQQLPDDCLSQHPFNSGLSAAALAARFARRGNTSRQELRDNRFQGARGSLWGEPTLFDVSGDALDLVNAAPDLSDNLQWARKSQRQTRSSSRLSTEGTPDLQRERVPESPFRWCSPPPPAHLSSSPPSDVFNLAKRFSPPRARPATRAERSNGGPVPPNESRRFTPWEDIWETEDELLDIGMLQPSRTLPTRRGRGGAGGMGGEGEGGRDQPTDSARPHLLQRAETFPCGYFEPPQISEGAEGNNFTVVNTCAARGMESRRAALLEAAREQALQQTRDAIQRHRTQRAQRLRERRASFMREEFGALMNALGILQAPEGGSDQPHEPRNSVVAMQEAVMGIARTGLPPHLLFTDRDFTGDDYEWLCRLDEGVENRKGADDDTINKLPTVSFYEMEDGVEEEEEDNDDEEVVDEKDDDEDLDPSKRCPICLDHFAPGDVLRVMPCQHKYHRDCLDRWLKIKATCPICNLNIKGE